MAHPEVADGGVSFQIQRVAVNILLSVQCKVGLLSPLRDASLGYGWRRWPPGMEGSSEYIGISNTMLSGFLVTIAWCVLRLQMVKQPPYMEGSCEYIE
jgi:hypothetical protein